MSSEFLITGADGFIGRHLCDKLADRGHAVHRLNRADADIADESRLLALARPVDAVVHLAFPTSHAFRESHPAKAHEQAIQGTSNAMELARTCGARHFVLASSGKVYGTPERLPLSEDHPVRPGTFLGELKLAQERIARRFAGDSGSLGVTALRLFNVYGPGSPPGFLVPKLVAGFKGSAPLLLGELEHRRDWIHIEDACQAFATVLPVSPPAGTTRVLNAGSGRSASARDLYELFCSISGKNPPLSTDSALGRPEEPGEERADCRRLRELGWGPRVDLETGLRRLWEDS